MRTRSNSNLIGKRFCVGECHQLLVGSTPSSPRLGPLFLPPRRLIRTSTPLIAVLPHLRPNWKQAHHNKHSHLTSNNKQIPIKQVCMCFHSSKSYARYAGFSKCEPSLQLSQPIDQPSRDTCLHWRSARSMAHQLLMDNVKKVGDIGTVNCLVETPADMVVL